MCAQMKTWCPEYKMTFHRENGAKLKKETQCPCTYKNKLILLCVQSLSTLLSGPKDSHTQTEASLAFLHTSTANHNHLCTPTANEKGLCTLNEVKTVPLNAP